MQQAFGLQLRMWRQRRRLSQLELGVTAEVSARHISFLETGRSQPSRRMIVRLSETLDIPRTERNALLVSAGFAASYASRRLDDSDMRFVRDALRWTMERHDPYPALSLDRHWNLVDANACAKALLEPMGLAVGTSLLEALIDDSKFSQALENREEVRGHLRNRLRAESSHLGGDHVLDNAIEQLPTNNRADFEPAAGPFPAVIPAVFQLDGIQLRLFSTISQFGSTEDVALADLKLELMFPADEMTEQFLQRANFGSD